jgi:hypothetical protein
LSYFFSHSHGQSQGIFLGKRQGILKRDSPAKSQRLRASVPAILREWKRQLKNIDSTASLVKLKSSYPGTPLITL